MIDCSELAQTKEYLLQQFEICKTLKADDMKLLVDYADSIGECNERGYVDSTSNGVTGVQNGTNKIFSVSEGSYISGSVTVFLSGQPLVKGNGLTETTPNTGVVTLDVAPQSYEIVIIQYTK